MPWLFYSLLSLASIIAYRIIQKKYISEKEVDPIAFGISESIWTIIITIPFVFLFGYSFTGGNKEIILLTIKSLLSGIGAILLYISLSKITASEFQIINSSIPLFTLLFGVLLFFEKVTINKAVALILLLVSIYIIFWHKDRIKINKYHIIAFLSAFIFSIVYTADKYLVSFFNTFTFLFLSFIIAQIGKIILFPQKILLIPKLYRKGNYGLFTIVTGVCLFGIYLFQYYAYQVGGDLSSVNIIKGTSTIFIVLLSALFLNDRKNLQNKIMASILVFIAIVVLAV